MALPELIYAPIDGGTIHRYEISGGKRKFLRFIGCYLGQCNFHKSIDDAIDYIKNLKESQKTSLHKKLFIVGGGPSGIELACKI